MLCAINSNERKIRYKKADIIIHIAMGTWTIVNFSVLICLCGEQLRYLNWSNVTLATFASFCGFECRKMRAQIKKTLRTNNITNKTAALLFFDFDLFDKFRISLLQFHSSTIQLWMTSHNAMLCITSNRTRRAQRFNGKSTKLVILILDTYSSEYCSIVCWMHNAQCTHTNHNFPSWIWMVFFVHWFGLVRLVRYRLTCNRHPSRC